MSDLQGLMPGTVAAYHALAQYGATQGIAFTVANFGGLRTLSDTTKILDYRQQDYDAARQAGTIRPDTTLSEFRPIAPFGSSYHNYGAAFDVWITRTPQGDAPNSWTEAPGAAAAKRVLGTYAPTIGLRWGGTFSNPDPPHFEVAVPLSLARTMYQEFLNSGDPSAQRPSSSPFDVSTFLPGLTSTADDDTAAVFDTPASAVVGDDSGDAEIALGPDRNGGSTSLLILGFFVAGLLAWAIRRKLR
jgi:hypothetical protein